MTKLSTFGVLVGAAVLCSAPFSVHRSPAKTIALSLDTVEARVGRPPTPMSVAGVPESRSPRILWCGGGSAAAAGACYYG